MKKHCFQVLQFIEVYKNANTNILHTSEKIFDSKLVNLTIDEPTSLIELNKIISKYRKSQMVELLRYYNEIVDEMVKVYRGFEAYLDSVSIRKAQMFLKIPRAAVERVYRRLAIYMSFT